MPFNKRYLRTTDAPAERHLKQKSRPQVTDLTMTWVIGQRLQKKPIGEANTQLLQPLVFKLLTTPPTGPSLLAAKNALRSLSSFTAIITSYFLRNHLMLYLTVP